MSETITVESLTQQALTLGLIKNKTEGKTLKKAGLLDLLAKHNMAKTIPATSVELPPLEEKCEYDVDGLCETHTGAEAHTDLQGSNAVAEPSAQEKDWAVRVLKALDMPPVLEVASFMQDHVHDENCLHDHPTSGNPPSVIGERAADSILSRYHNSQRFGRGGTTRDRAKAKAARKARRHNRR